MPYRKVPLSTNETYHIFNRTIAKQTAFNNIADYSRAIDLINYYHFSDITFRYSYLFRLNPKNRADYLALLKKPKVKIHAFCLMPNHYHFLLEQVTDSGITKFISNFQESYAKYFNLINERTGSLFEAMFKGVRVTSQELFTHTSRYIHLNPYSSNVIKVASQLDSYLWSSYPDYIGNTDHTFVHKDLTLGIFGSPAKLREFTLNHADYQRSLKLLSSSHIPGM